MTNEIINIVKNINLQKADSSFERIITLDELQSSGQLAELTFSYSMIENKSEDPIQYLLNHGEYLYAKTINGTMVAIDYLTNLCVMEEIKKNVIIGERVFYQSFKLIRTQDSIEIQFGNSLRLLNPNNNQKRQTRIIFKLQGALNDKVQDLEFILSLFEYRTIYINEVELVRIDDNFFEKNDFTKLSNLLLNLKKVQQALLTFDVNEELQLEDLSENDNINLSKLVSASEGNEIPLSDVDIPLGWYSIGNLSLFICVQHNPETNLYKVYNMYEAPYCVGFEENCTIRYPLPVVFALKKKDLVTCSNIQTEKVISLIKKFNCLTTEKIFYVNNFLLEAIGAYDISGKKSMLYLAESIIELIKEVPLLFDDIEKINELQIVKRKRELSDSEKNELISLIQKNESNNELKLCAFILLDEKISAKIEYTKLSKEKQELFWNYPISIFFKDNKC